MKLAITLCFKTETEHTCFSIKVFNMKKQKNKIQVAEQKEFQWL